ncbi:MAG: glycerol kinase GlpK [Caulobacteraceae bacterium]|nr:glycerol kinase GlpK [Caulobacteraceae bacterium]
MAPRYVAAVDQGTTSSRCMLFDAQGNVAGVARKEHRQIFPRPGWVEHDPLEIWANVQEVIAGALRQAGAGPGEVAALGITNQRETAVVWEKASGRPIANAVVWQDTRTDQLIRRLGGEAGQDRFRSRCGLPLATYFSGPKIRWLLDQTPGARARAERGELLFGTIDAWLIWNLVGAHITDVTNASRTMLMNLATLAWDEALAEAIGVPLAMAPAIRASAEIYGEARGVLAGVPVAAALGDQQAALFGQTCFSPGEAKCTYGTGNFLLVNTGERPATSANGLLTTVAYQVAGQAAVYALEGSIAVTGALVQWLRDNLGLIGSAMEIEGLALSVEDNGGCYIVPAFAGLFAPYWRSDARGVIAGLTGYVTKGHLARAVLEAAAWQTREIADAMAADAGAPLTALKVDGGMTANSLLMQFQADVLGVPVIRPAITETTALGAAYAAGLATGFWPDLAALRAQWRQDAQWRPAMDPAAREREFRQWKKAVERTFGWAD